MWLSAQTGRRSSAGHLITRSKFGTREVVMRFTRSEATLSRLLAWRSTQRDFGNHWPRHQTIVSCLTLGHRWVLTSHSPASENRSWPSIATIAVCDVVLRGRCMTDYRRNYLPNDIAMRRASTHNGFISVSAVNERESQNWTKRSDGRGLHLSVEVPN